MGKGGNDLIHGDDDLDFVFGEQIIGTTSVNGSDCLHGDAGVDFVFGDNLLDNTGTIGGDDLIEGNADIDLLFGDDLSNLWNPEPGGQDTIEGGDDFDFIFGNGGDDTLAGNAYMDVLFGNEGDDIIYAMDNTFTGDGWTIPNTNIVLGSVQFGGIGTDTMYGADGVDLQFGNAGDDTIYGKEYIDLQFGAAVADTMFGEEGGVLFTINSVSVRFGNLMFGGIDNDTMSGGGDLDVMFGLDGDDIIAGYDGNFVAAGIDADWMFGGNGNDDMEGDNEDSSLLTSIDFLFGEQGDDTLRGGSQPDLLLGGVGDDTLSGDSNGFLLVGSIDVMFGGSGQDTMDGGTSLDVMFGGDDDDSMIGDDETAGLISPDFMMGGAGDDTMNGGNLLDIVLGESGNDHILGDSGYTLQIASLDVLFGGTGNDFMNGGNAADLMVGEQGDDQMLGDSSFSFQISVDVMLGGAGDDDMDGGVSTDFMFGNDGCDMMKGDNNAGWMILSSDIMFGDGDCDDMLGGNGLLDIISGGDGHDTIGGQRGIDTIFGNDGADVINGGQFLDIISGGLGNDIVHGDQGIDVISGNEGDDCLFGDNSLDWISGGDGNDCLVGGKGPDRLDGGDGNDKLQGNEGPDRLIGGDGNDQLDGGSGPDWLSGNDGDDDLWGGPGIDSLNGNAGDDNLWGGSGVDVLNGGSGNDNTDQDGPNSGNLTCNCVTIACKFDFGDALTNGQTLLPNGPSHGLQGPRLGALADFEMDGQPTANADGDDLNKSDDEDGVGISTLIIGANTPVSVVLTNAGTALLDAWLDLNGDLTFAATEQIATGFVLNAGANTLNVFVPGSTLPGNVAARFRVSSAGGLTPIGQAPDGEVEDYLVRLEHPVDRDYGDAPLSYGTPSHNINGPRLGIQIDSEAGHQPSFSADLDDLTGIDDEDGVTLNWLNPGGSTAVTVELSNAATAKLDGWVDFDFNGTFDPSEHVFNAATITAGLNFLSFPVPATSALFTYARFRVSSGGEPSPTAASGPGEVEDYLVNGEIMVFDYGDAPDSYGTYFASNGPHHDLGGPQLGPAIDFDGNGQPSPNADADDLAGTTPDDEDGVTLTGLNVAGTATANVFVTNASSAKLDAWLDLNGNGSFDPSDQIFASAPVFAGANVLTFTLPSDTLPGLTFARFRISVNGGLGPLLYGNPGEVEDYAVMIAAAPNAIASRPLLALNLSNLATPKSPDRDEWSSSVNAGNAASQNATGELQRSQPGLELTVATVRAIDREGGQRLRRSPSTTHPEIRFELGQLPQEDDTGA